VKIKHFKLQKKEIVYKIKRIVYRIKIPQGVKNLFKINNIRVICIENQRFNVFFGWFSSLGLGVFLTSSKT